MTTLAVPYHCEGGVDRAGAALGLRQSGADWIGDCPACKGSGALAVWPSRDGDPAHVLFVCHGACLDPAALRIALAAVLGRGSRALPPRKSRMAGDPLNFGGAYPGAPE